jgi:uncharacterized protein YqeY
MTLKEKIVSDIKTAMKEKDILKRDTLRVLKGEIERAEQTKDGKVELSDADVVKLVKKAYKNLEEIISASSVSETYLQELEVLRLYLPQQMSHVEIANAVESIIDELKAESMKDMGKVMGKFNSEYSGKADGSIVSKIVKEMLQ